MGVWAVGIIVSHFVGITATSGRRARMLTGWIAKYKTGKQVARYRAELAELVLIITPIDALGLELLTALGLSYFDSADDLATWRRIVERVDEADIRAAFRVEWAAHMRGLELLGRLLDGLGAVSSEVKK